MPLAALLSATNATAQVNAAEQTGSQDRANAVALVAAGYSAGAGATVVLHGSAGGTLGFRGLFLLAFVPLPLLLLAWRWAGEPGRFTIAAVAARCPFMVRCQPPTVHACSPCPAWPSRPR